MHAHTARILLTIGVALGLGDPVFAATTHDAITPCDAACLEDRRLSTGVKGFPAPGRPVLLEYAQGASPQQLAAQYQALLQIEDVKVQYDRRGVPRYISGKTQLDLPNNFRLPEGKSALDRVLARLRPLLLAEGSESLEVEKISPRTLGGITVVLKESIRGIPVRDGQITLNTDGRTQRVTRITASFLPDRTLPREPTISRDEAINRAFDWLREYETMRQKREQQVDIPPAERPSVLAPEFSIENVKVEQAPTLAYLIGDVEASPSTPHLVWEVDLSHNGSKFKGISVDALNGAIVGVADHVFEIERHVYNSNSTSANPGTFLFSEGQSNPDTVATTAYNNVGLAHSALARVVTPSMESLPYRISVRFVREPGEEVKSWVDRTFSGGTLYQNVRFGPGRANDPARPSMHLGNALDVAAHEVGHHAVFSNSSLSSCQVDCGERGGALNEGFADIAAIVSDMTYGRPVPWNVGDVFTDNLGFRSASAPTASSAMSSDYWPLRSLVLPSEGAPHRNATIFTHAYYLLFMGGYHNRAGTAGIPFSYVPGVDRDRAETVFLEALKSNEFVGASTFFDARRITEDTAMEFYGQSTKNSVSAAWDAVGVIPCTNVPPPPQVSLTDWCPWWQIAVSTVPGATIYGIQGAYSPSFATPWTQAQGENPSCRTQLYQRTYFRARACNGCGCSAWGPTDWAQPYGAPCP